MARGLLPDVLALSCVLVMTSPTSVAAGAPIRCASPAEGPCLVADTVDVLFDGQAQPLLVMNFGILAAGPAGEHATVCEEAFGGRTPEQLALTASGFVLVPARSGVFRGKVGAPCHWSLAAGLPADTYVQQVVVDPQVAGRVWALVGAGERRALYVSEDEGQSFSLRHDFPRGQVWWRLFALASPERRLYVAGPGQVGPFALGVSANEGKTFEVSDPVPPFADPMRTTILLGASPAASDRLYFGRDTADSGDEIWLSEDGGRTAVRTLVLPQGQVVGGFSFGASPETLYVGSRALLVSGAAKDAALFVSNDHGKTFQPIEAAGDTGPRFRCLRWKDGWLFGCGGGVDVGDAAYLFRSRDGAAWEPLLNAASLGAPPACLRDACAETTAWLCTSYGACAPDGGMDSDAGLADAGAPLATGSGCGCQVGGAEPARGLAGLALFALVPAVWRRRRRRERRKLRP